MPDQPLLARYGASAITAGYPIVPLPPGEKWPAGVGHWQSLEMAAGAVPRWVKAGYTGFGVLGHTVPAIDIDVDDDGTVDWLLDVIASEAGVEALPVRIGRAPRALVPFRLPPDTAPLAKGSTPNWCDPFVDALHHVEVLGDGQQWVAQHVHPGTGQPYRWLDWRRHAPAGTVPGEQGGPAGLGGMPPLDHLPILTPEAVGRILEQFDAHAVEQGWERRSRGAKVQLAIDIAADPDAALAAAQPPMGLAAAQIADILRHIPNDGADVPYDEWLEVGMALHHETGGAPHGLEAWLAWSARSDKHDGETCERKWPSLQPAPGRRPVTMRSLAARARKLERAEAAQDDGLDAWLARFVHIADGDRVYDLLADTDCRPAVYRLRDLASALAHHRDEVPDGKDKDGEDKTKLIGRLKLWQVDTRKKVAYATTYAPGAPRVITGADGKMVLNEFVQPDHAGAAEAARAAGLTADPLVDHVRWLCPLPGEAEWLLDWMAFTVQFPDRRCKVTPLHIATGHGTGRGWLVELLQAVLGPRNVTKTKMSVVTGEGSRGAYQDYLSRSLLVCIEEVREAGKDRFRVDDKVRDLLTEDWLEVNRKYGSNGTQRVYANFLLMSNHRDALTIDPQDRRLQVLTGPDHARELAYYDRLYGWKRDPRAVAAAWEHLASRDLSAFQWQRSTPTPARSHLLDSDASDVSVAFDALRDAPTCPLMDTRHVVEVLRLQCRGFGVPLEAEVKRLLRQQCHRPLGRVQIEREGVRLRPWLIARDVSLPAGADPAEWVSDVLASTWPELMQLEGGWRESGFAVSA